MMRRHIIVILIFNLILVPTFAFAPIIYENNISHAAYVRALPESTGQTLADPSLKVELTFKDGLKGPITGMAFLGPENLKRKPSRHTTSTSEGWNRSRVGNVGNCSVKE